MWLAGFAGLLAWRYRPARPSRSVVLPTFRCSVLRRAAPPYSRAAATAYFAAAYNFSGSPSSRARSLRLLSGAFPPAVGYEGPRMTIAVASLAVLLPIRFFPER